MRYTIQTTNQPTLAKKIQTAQIHPVKTLKYNKILNNIYNTISFKYYVKSEFKKAFGSDLKRMESNINSPSFLPVWS